MIPATIIACCVIHNICLSYNEDNDVVEHYENEGLGFVLEPEEHIAIDNVGARDNGIMFRNLLAHNL